MARDLPTLDHVVDWAKTLSNWGRWGTDDEFGTLNFITPQARSRAAAEVQLGISVSCAWEVPASSRLGGTVNRFMLQTGDALAAADPDRHVHVAGEVLQFQFHGFEMTHLDALSHMFWDAKMYNGRPATDVRGDVGAVQLGVETIRDGIVTRGVILDIPPVRGVKWLEPGDGVFPEDLEAAEERQGVRVGSGDALLLHTGFSAYRREQQGHVSMEVGWPGWQAACLPWLHDREVSLIGTDGNNETLPNGYDSIMRHPIHCIGIVAMGLWLIDNCNLEALAEASRSHRRSTFLLVVAPVPIKGATGGPVNPIAIL
jgi:kynurenine formamidase